MIERLSKVPEIWIITYITLTIISCDFYLFVYVQKIRVTLARIRNYPQRRSITRSQKSCHRSHKKVQFVKKYRGNMTIKRSIQ